VRAGYRGTGGGRGHDGPVAGSVADLAPDADPLAVARAIALRQLTIAARTRAQLADILARRGVADDVARTLLDRFEEVDLLDDEQFSRTWVRSRHAGRGLSRRALAHELSQRGVADPTVREAVDEITPDDELVVARDLVRRRLPGMRGDDPLRRTRRLAGMLARKGYGPEVAMRAVHEELDAAGLDRWSSDGAEGVDPGIDQGDPGPLDDMVGAEGLAHGT
jgi:regulatory protein